MALYSAALALCAQANIFATLPIVRSYLSFDMHAWIWLGLGAITEIGWVAGLKMADSFAAWLATLVCAVASIALALGATRDLPATTVYILFVGLGAIGTALFEALVLDTHLSLEAYLCLVSLVVCIVGLKKTGAPSERA